MKKIKVFTAVVLITSILGFTSFAAVTPLPNGAKTIDSADIIDPLNENAKILDDHIDNVAGTNVLGHVKIGAGLQASEDGTASVKIANDLTTDDSETALSAAMGVKLNYDLETISDNLITQTSTCTVADGFTANRNKCLINNKTVSIIISGSFDTAQPTGTLIATIPEEYRINFTDAIKVKTGTAGDGSAGTLYVSSNGSIVLYTDSGANFKTIDGYIITYVNE